MKFLVHRFLGVLVCGIVLFGPAGILCAQVNLIQNGNFLQTNTTGVPSGTANANGGQLGYNINATGWSNNFYNGSTVGYNFLFTSSSFTNNTNGVVGNAGSLNLWTTTNGGLNTITAPPTNSYFTNAGNIIASDGVYQSASIQQTVTNLVVNQQYFVSFYWGAAQQKGFTSDTSSGWQVTFGGTTQSTALQTNASHGFSGWQQSQFRYTATSTSMILSFFALGTPTGVPPFAVLGNVSLVAVPEASSMIAGFLLLSVICAGPIWQSMRRRKLQPDG